MAAWLFSCSLALLLAVCIGSTVDAGRTLPRSKPVTELPGFGAVKWTSGYLTANASSGNYLFYILIPARNTSRTPPLTVWINGGPGTSSMMGLFLENGPVRMQANGTLTYNPYSWNEYSDMLYIDQPAGTGYSYTSTGSYVQSLQQSTEQFYTALQDFFKSNKQYLNVPFFLTGESFAGHYLPAITTYIDRANKNLANGDVYIPLEAVAIGNGWMDPVSQMYSYANYAFQNGLIDEYQRAHAQSLFDKAAEAILAAETREQWIEASNLEGVANQYIMNCSGLVDEDYILAFVPPMGEQRVALYEFLNNATVQAELGTTGHHWILDNADVGTGLSGDTMQSIIDLLPGIIANHRLMFYIGNMDMICNIVGVNYVVQRMDWLGKHKFFVAERGLWKLDDLVVGYAKNYENFTQVVVRNAGHEVPFFCPEPAADMFYNFIFNLPFF